MPGFLALMTVSPGNRAPARIQVQMVQLEVLTRTVSVRSGWVKLSQVRVIKDPLGKVQMQEVRGKRKSSGSLPPLLPGLWEGHAEITQGSPARTETLSRSQGPSPEAHSQPSQRWVFLITVDLEERKKCQSVIPLSDALICCFSNVP